MIAKVRKPSQEELNKRKERERVYDYYGIPYGVFDENSTPKEVERDWSRAISLLAKGEKIPKELEERLLKYKQRAESNK